MFFLLMFIILNVRKGNIFDDIVYFSEWKLGVVWKCCGDFVMEWKLDYFWKFFK